MTNPDGHRLRLFASLGLAPLLFACAGSADMVVRADVVRTGDAVHPSAEAFAVRDGVVVAVDDAETIWDYVGPRTEVLHLEGKTVVPAFFDFSVLGSVEAPAAGESLAEALRARTASGFAGARVEVDAAGLAELRELDRSGELDLFAEVGIENAADGDHLRAGVVRRAVADLGDGLEAFARDADGRGVPLALVTATPEEAARAVDALRDARLANRSLPLPHRIAATGGVSPETLRQAASLGFGLELALDDPTVEAAMELGVGVMVSAPDPWVLLEHAAEESPVEMDTALACITRSAAKAAGLDTAGSIQPGKRADFCVLDRDPWSVPVDDIDGTVVIATWFGGSLVHRYHWVEFE